jgi:GrpB-like predicted nucleotidyltransferase (UPF0157 family)
MNNDPVIIVPYDPGWVDIFKNEAKLLLQSIPFSNIAIEHIGSTSVVGLAAKPIIDIMIGFASLKDAETSIAQIEILDYEYIPEYEVEIPDRRYFHKPITPPRKFHLHCAEINGNFWNKQTTFRDYLRTHPQACSKYEQLKEKLAVQYRLDRVAYTDAKTEFIVGILKKAGENNP